MDSCNKIHFDSATSIAEIRYQIGAVIVYVNIFAPQSTVSLEHPAAGLSS